MQVIPGFTVDVCGRGAEFDRAQAERRFTHLIAFDDAGCPRTPPSDTSLILDMADVYWAEEHDKLPLGTTPPNRDHIAAIIGFAVNHAQNLPVRLLCRCHAGVSRSPAAALIVATAITRDAVDPAVHLDALAQERPAIWPNEHMLTLAADLLGPSGRALLVAFHAWRAALPSATLRAIISDAGRIR
jgi:predicted protein tyrosine phosphatase